MKFPLSTNGTTTVNELIAALLEFPPNAQISIYGDIFQGATMTVKNADGVLATILEM